MKWEKNNLGLRQAKKMDEKDFKVSEWAEEVAKKSGKNVLTIMSEYCKEMTRVKDDEKAKLNVANFMINGK